ncbi:MAG: hypothetical protein HOV94_12835, partial [Saccharothrix sp.]|nr:hypothetical protein [Saccharothrix sp.]
LMRNQGAALDTVPQRPATTRRHGVRRAVGIGGTALGVAGVIALTSAVLTGGTPAYAVSKDADGVVTVSITDLTGVTGANEELRRLGVRAVAVPMRDGCVDLADLPVDPDSQGTGITSTVSTVDGVDSGSVTFEADSIPEGDTLLLAASQSPTSLSLAAAMIKGDAPECVSAPTPPADGQPGQEAGTNSVDEGGN